MQSSPVKEVDETRIPKEKKLKRAIQLLENLLDDDYAKRCGYDYEYDIDFVKKENEKIRNEEKSIIKVSVSTKQGTLEIHTESKIENDHNRDLDFLNGNQAKDEKNIYYWSSWANYIENKHRKLKII